ncbi:MAG: nucleotidyltransferase family protein [Chitinophagales bacterium]
MTNIKEAIILAGGLGTRLSETVPGLPKSLAPVAGRPFLQYIMDYLYSQGISRYIFSLGHRYELILKFLEENFPNLAIAYCIEKTPLGTGGAIKLACSKLNSDDAFVLNGDTIFRVDLGAMSDYHHEKSAECTIALKPMKNIDRYGVVELNADGSIARFHEKKFFEDGFINGGIYILNRDKFLQGDLPEKFSFEKDYLERNIDQMKIFGFVQDLYFIDIGVPEDYKRAQTELLPFSKL